MYFACPILMQACLPNMASKIMFDIMWSGPVCSQKYPNNAFGEAFFRIMSAR